MAGIQPWERMSGESEPAFQAFSIYRDLGLDRSLAKVGATVGKNIKLIERWSTRDGWVARAEAWDREQDRQWHLAQAKSRREMATRHVKVANAFMNKVIKRLNEFDPDELSPKDLVQWLDAAAKVERLALGEPTRHEITGVNGGPIALEIGLSPEERRARIEELQKELAHRVNSLPGPRLALAAAHDGGTDI